MIFSPDSAKPIYIQMSEHLQRQIQAGVYPVGCKLPSERELAEQFQVSRMTARQAVQELVQRGQAYSQVGKGTFVSPPKIHQELRELTSFSEEMRRRGNTPSSIVVMKAVQNADAHVAYYLQINEHDPIAVLQRVRLADGKPMALETAHLNARFCPHLLENHNFSHQSLYEVLNETYNIRLVWANQLIEARLPDEHEQAQLNIQTTDPVLSLTRVTFDEADQPIEFVRSVYIGKHYQLRTILKMEA